MIMNNRYVELTTIGGNTNNEPLFLVTVGTLNRNDCYINVHNSSRWQNATTILRLSFKGNEAYQYKSGTDQKFWKPSKVPFKKIIDWLKKPNKCYPSLTNWHECIRRWNIECGYNATTDEFLDGTADKFYKGKRQYVMSTTLMPKWNKNLIIHNIYLSLSGDRLETMPDYRLLRRK